MNVDVIKNSIETNQNDELLNVASKFNDSEKTKVGNNFENNRNKVDQLELGDQKVSESEMNAYKSILFFSLKENFPVNKTNYRQIINDIFGYDINKNGGEKLDPQQKKENKKFFGALLYDLGTYYKQNRSNTINGEENAIQEERKLLDVAKIFLTLMELSPSNPYKQLEDRRWKSNYAVIEKSMMHEINQPEIDASIKAFEDTRNKKIITQSWYTLIKESNPYIVSHQGKKITKEEQELFTGKWFSIIEEQSDKREKQDPIHEQYILPENIIDTKVISNLPGFKELREKIQDPNIRINEINIVGMASYIPTDLNQEIFAYMDSKNKSRPNSKEENNKYLSEARALIAKDRIQEILQQNNYDINTINIITSNKVDGPVWDTKYNNPIFREEREKLYHPYQGVDFTVAYEKKQKQYDYILDRKIEWPKDDMLFWLTTEIIVPQSLLKQNNIIVKDNSGNKLESEYILLQLSSNATAIAWKTLLSRNFSTIAPTTAKLKMKGAINANITNEKDIELNVMQQWQNEKVKNTPVLYINDVSIFNEINENLVKDAFTSNQAARMMKRLLKEQAKKWGIQPQL